LFDFGKHGLYLSKNKKFKWPEFREMGGFWWRID